MGNAENYRPLHDEHSYQGDYDAGRRYVCQYRHKRREMYIRTATPLGMAQLSWHEVIGGRSNGPSIVGRPLGFEE